MVWQMDPTSVGSGSSRRNCIRIQLRCWFSRAVAYAVSDQLSGAGSSVLRPVQVSSWTGRGIRCWIISLSKEPPWAPVRRTWGSVSVWASASAMPCLQAARALSGSKLPPVSLDSSPWSRFRSRSSRATEAALLVWGRESRNRNSMFPCCRSTS